MDREKNIEAGGQLWDRRWGGLSSQAGSSLLITVETQVSNDFIKALKQYFVANKASYVIKRVVYRNLGLQRLSQETAASIWAASS